ncbi:MAG TPA: hypothetical protein VJ302_35260 [Blastocatellia bacterium]|nr:hypothetical protein [Blastocatellia bacterium]
MCGIPAAKTKKDNRLTQNSLDLLLAELDADRERAAATYERIRRALIAFFEFRGSRDPCHDTDQTINRVARRLSEGQVITAANPASYFYAVARNLWRERLAESTAETTFDENSSSEISLDPTPLDLLERAEEQRAFDLRLACLELCLKQLSAEERELITAYYRGEGRDKIQVRRELAARLSVTAGALRLRACRIRARLEDGVNDCCANREKWDRRR